MQVAAISAIANFNGKNQNFKKHIVESEKNTTGGGRNFAEILDDAMKVARPCKSAGTHSH